MNNMLSQFSSADIILKVKKCSEPKYFFTTFEQEVVRKNSEEF